MNVLKNILTHWYKYVLWALMSLIVWAWIFGLLTDVPPENRLLLCVDLPELRDKALSETLSENRPEDIKLVEVHAFDYYMFGAEELCGADLYIVGENEAEEYIDSFLPLDETGFPADGRTVWRHNGAPYGIRIYDAASGEGAAASYLGYPAGGAPAQDYYLFFGSQSAHREDGKALRLAEALLALP